MSDTNDWECVCIAPQGFAKHDYTSHAQTRRHETYTSPRGAVNVVWVWDGTTFRMDLAAPRALALDIAIPKHVVTVYVNGELVWGNHAFQANTAGVAAIRETSDELRLACPSGGAYHILASLLSGSA